MASRSTHVRSTPDEVWAVLADPWSYATWVVGTVKIREADEAWPAVFLFLLDEVVVLALSFNVVRFMME